MRYIRKARYVGPIKEWRGQTFLAKRFKETFDSKYTWVYQADLFDHPMAQGWHDIPRHHMRFFTPEYLPGLSDPSLAHTTGVATGRWSTDRQSFREVSKKRTLDSQLLLSDKD